MRSWTNCELITASLEITIKLQSEDLTNEQRQELTKIKEEARRELDSRKAGIKWQ